MKMNIATSDFDLLLCVRQLSTYLPLMILLWREKVNSIK